MSFVSNNRLKNGVVSAVMCVAFSVPLSACGESDTKVTDTSDFNRKVQKLADSGTVLPYGVFFKEDGSPIIVDFNTDKSRTKIVDVNSSEFPIQAKIKRIETITFVTYEGSCEVLSKTKTGYKKIIIENDAICNAIQP